MIKQVYVFLNEVGIYLWDIGLLIGLYKAFGIIGFLYLIVVFLHIINTLEFFVGGRTISAGGILMRLKYPITIFYVLALIFIPCIENALILIGVCCICYAKTAMYVDITKNTEHLE